MQDTSTLDPGSTAAVGEDEEDELDALLDSYAAQAARDVQAVQAKAKQKPKGQTKGMKEAREEGLATALGADNKGFQLLAKMGYKEGSALGA